MAVAAAHADVRAAQNRGESLAEGRMEMNAFGVVLGFLGAVGMAAGLFIDSAVGRVANLDLMNFKLLMMTGGGAVFVAGCVLVGADAIREAIVATAKKSEVVSNNTNDPADGDQYVTKQTYKGDKQTK